MYISSARFSSEIEVPQLGSEPFQLGSSRESQLELITKLGTSRCQVARQLTCTFLQYCKTYILRIIMLKMKTISQMKVMLYFNTVVLSLQCIKIKGEQILCLKTTLKVEIRPGGTVLKLVGTSKLKAINVIKTGKTIQSSQRKKK